MGIVQLSAWVSFDRRRVRVEARRGRAVQIVNLLGSEPKQATRVFHYRKNWYNFHKRLFSFLKFAELHCLRRINGEANSIVRFSLLHGRISINPDGSGAGETTMQRIVALRFPRILVLASHRWPTMLVRRQADAFEILAGVACSGSSAVRC